MRRALALVAALSAIVLVSCAAAPDIGRDATLDAELPTGVSIDVYQTRTDPPARQLEIAITNSSDRDLTITAAEFSSPQFVATALWAPRPGGTLIRSGTGVDLPVRLAAPACDDPAPRGIVRITFRTSDGRTGRAELPAVDRYDRLPGMRSEECLAVAVAEVATLSIERPARVESTNGALIAFVPVTVTPTASPGAFTIEHLENTVLLDLSDGHGGALDSLPLGLVARGGAPPSSFDIPIMPGRCDPHAIAEDKQGTIFILQVTAPDGSSGPVRVAATSNARASIYAYIAQACDLPR